MKNFVQSGHSLTLTAPSGGIVSGAGVLVGSLFAVAAFSAAEGEAFEGATVGVFDLAKTSAQAWTVGAKIYWDATNKVCTTTSSGNSLIGVATLAAGNPSAIGRVRLNGVSV